jgi:hypothetical protein
VIEYAKISNCCGLRAEVKKHIQSTDQFDTLMLRLNISDRDKDILHQRFGLAHRKVSLKKIGKDMGVSQERIRQREQHTYLAMLDHIRRETEIANLAKNLDDLPNASVQILNLSTRSRNALARIRVETIGQLTNYTLEDLSNYKRIGKITVDEIIEKLAGLSLKLKDEITKEAGSKLTSLNLKHKNGG